MISEAALLPPGLQSREALSVAERTEMYELLERHFDGVTPEQFAADLEAKDWVVQVRVDERLVGFSTLRVREVTLGGERATAIWSGDTIMAPEAWGTPALARTWIRAVNHLRGTRPGLPCWWLLLCSGFRTWRFLPVFWRRFYPHPEFGATARERVWWEHLARLGYGDDFDADTGVVRLPHPQRLRGGLAEIPLGRDEDPWVRFFLERNPGHAAGDELACLTQIDEANLTSAGRRMVRI